MCESDDTFHYICIDNCTGMNIVICYDFITFYQMEVIKIFLSYQIILANGSNKYYFVLFESKKICFFIILPHLDDK